MLKALIHSSCSFPSFLRSCKYLQYHSILRFSSTSDPNKQRQDANQITLDYATLLQYVRPEMATRIQQLIDHENYLSSLSQQIAEKKLYHEKLAKKQKHEQPQPHNQKLSNVVMESLKNIDSSKEEDIDIPDEPGLDFEDLSSFKTFQSTFYGPSPLNSFDELDIDKNLIKAINEMGINIPSHIQQLSIPQILSGSNCVIGAETGTGKTIAYVLPILHKLLNDKTITTSKYEPISKFAETYLSKENERKSYHKYHPFEFDAEKKYPFCIIIQPNEHLSVQTQKIINEILDRYYDNTYIENRDNPNFYKLKTMSLHGRALLPKSNEMMPDILITTTTALLTNLHKKHNENRFRSFLSKIRYIILDEADFLTRSSSRFQLKYIFARLKELQQQITNNPLKYKLLIPKYLREQEYGCNPSLLYRELNKMGKPQMIFVGATIPTEGGRNVAETIRDFFDDAVWIKTPGLHEICGHIAQQFRFVPHGMELDILHQILINLCRDHLNKTMFETDDDILFNKETDLKIKQETGRHKKRKKRAKKPKNMKEIEFENKRKQLHILVFVNTKKFTRECYKYLLENGWFNTRCIHSELHREERKLRLNDFQNGIIANNEDIINDNIIKKNIAINDAINDNDAENDNFEYKEIVNNIHILVTSDFANRGIDFKNVDIVINCQFPNHAIDYLHRCGRTGRGGNNGKVISFFNQYDLDLSWHIQMGLINQYKKILNGLSSTEEEEEDSNRIGTTSVRLDDCFGIEDESIGKILKNYKGNKGGYSKMSLPRDYQKTIDLTRIDIDEMDEKLCDHIIKYAKKQKWINKQDEKSDTMQLKELIKERKDKKWKLKVPWPYQLTMTN